MIYVAGSRPAEAPVRVGLPHDVVVRALVAEIGLTAMEAERAWRRAAPIYDEIPAIRRAVRALHRSATSSSE